MQRTDHTKINKANLKIRAGKFNDLKQALNLVKELAIYELEPEAVTASLEEYQELFTANKFKFFVAELDAKIIGIAIFYDTFSTWKGKMIHLEDLLITEKLRGKGIGRLLFERMIAHAKDEKCALLKWEVLDWNKPAINFYEKFDAIIEKQWWNGKLILDKRKYPDKTA